MAFDVLDEHEQGELVQKWLRENAWSIVIGVAAALALLFGWQQWKVHRVNRVKEATAQYQALTEAVTAKKDADVATIADGLRKDFQSTVYAAFAAMQQADAAVIKGDLTAAAEHLQWAREHAGADSLRSLFDLRLARVKLAQGDADGAIKLLDGIAKTDYVGLVNEIRGDALVKLGRSDDARAAYQEALDKLDPQAPNRVFVQMKLDDLATTALAPAAPSSATDTTVTAEKRGS
ncbi:MAG: tetratricopeptide repeat protein [Rhodanobacter sp.]|jgi:predicted negative regulator of RcsB-dependent stress response|nr:tetratricopeptide repeat protein [Rhodanobacter sp.]